MISLFPIRAGATASPFCRTPVRLKLATVMTLYSCACVVNTAANARIPLSAARFISFFIAALALVSPYVAMRHNGRTFDRYTVARNSRGTFPTLPGGMLLAPSGWAQVIGDAVSNYFRDLLPSKNCMAGLSLIVFVLPAFAALF